MGFYLTALEAGTEGITAEEVSDTIEQMKKPGVVRTYLEGWCRIYWRFSFRW